MNSPNPPSASSDSSSMTENESKSQEYNEKKNISDDSAEPVHNSDSSTDFGDPPAELSPIIPKKQFWFLRLFTDKSIPPIPIEKEPYRLLNANFFSFITFWWLNPLMYTGFKRQLEQEDLWLMQGNLSIEYTTELLERNIEERLNKFHKKNIETTTDSTHIPPKVLLLALFDTFKKRFIISGLFKISNDVGQTLSPLLVRALINFVDKIDVLPHTPIGRGVGYSVGLFFLLIFNSICMNHFFHFSMLTGSLIKSTLTNVLYKKTYKMNLNSKCEFSNGKITGLMTNDLGRIDLAASYFHFNWTFPISLSISLAILIVNLGPSALAGFAVIVFLIGIAVVSTKIFARQRKNSNKYIDRRVQAIRELISNLKMIKFYSWEEPYNEIIQDYRTKESKIILKMQILKSVINSTVLSVPILSAMVAFLVMYSTGRKMKANEIFSSVSMFNIMRQPLMLMPTALAYASDASVAIRRISDFLNCEEEDNYLKFAEDLKDDDNNALAIKIKDATFRWGSSSPATKKQSTQNASKKKITENVPLEKQLSGVTDLKESFPGLLDINLSVKKGEFIVVSGLIGSGKTSLLSAMAGQMNLESGEIEISTPGQGNLIYCQYPWIQNTTIRANILFGLKYDFQIYQSVIHSCSLNIDFKMFEGGDLTEVGERGITLSGGQKARINLARAIYASQIIPDSNDIILLDDVLSAVDARVGKHIMDNCINGLISAKTRILATHQLSLIGSADRIVFMNGSGGIDVGSYDELYQTNQEFINLMEFSKDEKNEENEIDVIEDQTSEQNEKFEETKGEKSKQDFLVQSSTAADAILSKQGKITINEKRESGSISFKVYLAFLKLGAGVFKFTVGPVFILFFCITIFLQFFQSIWLTFWIEDRFHQLDNAKYIGVYILLCIMCFFGFCSMFGIVTYVNNRAGYNLFNLSTKNILKAPMSFMDTTPIGRILNRFTKDVDTLDNDNPEQLRLVLVSSGFMLGVLVMSIVYMPWFGLAIPPVGFIYINFMKYYQASALDIKRIESINRSLSYSHFNESLNGLNTIKSFHATERFLIQNEKLMNTQNSASFLVFASQRWLSIRLDLLAAALAFVINMLCITGQMNISPASAGLVMAYIIQISGILSLFIRALTQFETNMNSVERLYEYAYDLPEEKPFKITETTPPPEWPQAGAIRFENASMSYRPGLPLVLKSLSVEVKAGEKIGICGRTGAGKSTIMMALFRLTELQEGRIIIDDIDIGKIGLSDLRSKLTIIPQDPVLFQGTIRQNLDPFHQASDAQLWDSLRRSWLIEEGERVEDDKHNGEDQSLHKFHLDQIVEDEGANFSLGERQLIALARALVRNSKILILDEATSSVDYETDSKIQSTIVKEFSHCTILCIAHRLKTILNYDKILVLDKGEVREFDTPLNLFNLNNSIFRQMCDRSNITSEDFEF